LVFIGSYLHAKRKPKKDFAGKTVVVTGASAGFGEEICKQFARVGANIVLAARRKEQLEAVAQECKRLGAPKTLVVQCDVTVREQCTHLINQAITEYGRIDVLIPNAGVLGEFWFDELQDLTTVDQILDLNVTGVINVTHFALPYLKKVHGSIGALGSVASHATARRYSVYTATKWFIRAFFESLALDLCGSVDITVICPGYSLTEMHTKQSVFSSDGAKTKSKVTDQFMVKHFLMATPEQVAKELLRGLEQRKSEMLVPFFPVWVLSKMYIFTPTWLWQWLDRTLVAPLLGDSFARK